MSESTASQQILEQAKEKLPGQTMSPEMKKKAEQNQGLLDTKDAAEFTEELVAYLNREWNARNFTAEQRIFSIALTTINLREHIPEKLPDGNIAGKAFFDRVCVMAREYFDKNR